MSLRSKLFAPELRGARYRYVSDNVWEGKFPKITAVMLQEGVLPNSCDVWRKPVPTNRLTPFIVKSIKDEVVKLTFGTSLIKDFTKAVLFVQTNRKNKDIAEDCMNQIALFDGDYYSYDAVQESFVSLTNGEFKKYDALVDENGDFRDGVIVYNDSPFISGITSAGAMTKGMTMLLAENCPGFDIDAMRDALWLGMDKEFEHYGEFYLSNPAKAGKFIAQASTRIGQVLADCVTTIPVRSFAIYCGKFADGDGFEWCDGEAPMSAKFLAEAISDVIGEELSEKDCVGLHGQMRPWSCKGKLFAVSQKMLNFIVSEQSWLADKVETVVIKRQELPSFSRAINDALVMKEGPLVGKFLIVVEEGETIEDISMLLDFNAIKAPLDWSRKSGLNIMDISHDFHGTKGGARTSTQMLSILSSISFNDSKSLIVSACVDEIMKKEEVFNSTEGRAIESLDGQDLLLAAAQVAPGLFNAYKPLFKSVMNKTLEGLVRRSNNNKYPIEGFDGYFTADIGKFFGVELLGDNEVFCPAMEIAGIERGIIVKYPSVHVCQYLGARNVTMDEMFMRLVDKFGFDDERLDLALDYLSSLAPSTIMIGSNPYLLNLLAGMDFDGDKGVCFTDEKVQNISDKARPENQPLAVVIG